LSTFTSTFLYPAFFDYLTSAANAGLAEVVDLAGVFFAGVFFAGALGFWTSFSNSLTSADSLDGVSGAFGALGTVFTAVFLAVLAVLTDLAVLGPVLTPGFLFFPDGGLLMSSVLCLYLTVVCLDPSPNVYLDGGLHLIRQSVLSDGLDEYVTLPCLTERAPSFFFADLRFVAISFISYRYHQGSHVSTVFPNLPDL